MDVNNFEVVKQSLGNVIYSQKTHEMALNRKKSYITYIKWFNIILVGIVFLVLFIGLFNPKDQIYNYIGITVTVLETLFLIFQLSFTPEKEVEGHQNTANRLWLMREKHLNLLTDIKNEIYDSISTAQKRDTLTSELSEIYKNAPRTNNDDYEKATKALNGNQKPKADEDEMNTFLPPNLQSNGN